MQNGALGSSYQSNLVKQETLRPDVLVNRFSEQLAKLAEREIGTLLSRRTSAEEIVQTVFRTFFRRNEAGQFRVEHDGALWQLLVTLTLNKIRKAAERHSALRRDVRREVLVDPSDLGWLADHASQPDSLVILADELEWLLKNLDSREVEIVKGLMEDVPVQELAHSVGCSRSTVRRVRERLLFKLRQRILEDSEKMPDSVRHSPNTAGC